MGKLDSELQRLFRAAEPDDPPIEMPFGFDTRVVAQWRARRPESSEALSFARFFPRVALSAMMLTVCAGFGAWWQLRQNDELTEPANNSYAIADTVIDAAAFQ